MNREGLLKANWKLAYAVLLSTLANHNVFRVLHVALAYTGIKVIPAPETLQG